MCIEKKESLGYLSELIDAMPSVLLDEPIHYTTMDEYMKKIKVFVYKQVQRPYIIVDPALQLDGSFLAFCKDNGYMIEKLFMECINSLSEKDCIEHDPFIFCGGVLITKDDFKFVKFSTIDMLNESSIIAVGFVETGCYNQYLQMKSDYFKWVDKEKGPIVTVVGGEDYIVDDAYDWDALFYGEKVDLKKGVKKHIDCFLANKSLYLDKKIDWKTTVLVEGLEGSGKTSLVNSIISSCDMDVVTISPANVDDTVMDLVFNAVSKRKRCMLLLEDVDELIDMEITTATSLVDLVLKCKTNKGLFILMTTSKKIDEFESVCFDKVIKLDFPDYENTVKILFGQYIPTKNIKEFILLLENGKFTYGNIDKLYNVFIKSHLEDKSMKTKSSKYFSELVEILELLSMENELNEKSTKTTKSVGLLS